MRKIHLNLDALEVKSFATSFPDAARAQEMAPTDFCGSAVSETNGVAICKSCGPCCA